MSKGEAMIIEKRKTNAYAITLKMEFPMTDYRGNIIMSERRRHQSRRSYDVSAGENRFYYQLN